MSRIPIIIIIFESAVLSEQSCESTSRHLRERMAQPLLTINTSIVLVKSSQTLNNMYSERHPARGECDVSRNI
jgi:hypothetical protein